MLGESVRRRRKALRMSQADLALIAECSRPFVSELERGKTSVRLDVLLKVLSALGLGLRLSNSTVPFTIEEDLAGD